MSILVANIGHSDIQIEVGGYYLPLESRMEPNLELPMSGSPECSIWKCRLDNLKVAFKDELDINIDTDLRNHFREISFQLSKQYERWNPYVKIGRIQGLIQKALTFDSNLQAYLVVTNQPKTEKKGYPSDTVHVFDLIESKLKQENPNWFIGEIPKLSLKKVEITFKAVEEDQLFDYYQTLFHDFGSEETVYVSIKGGTPQMQTALKMQAIASNTKAQIFLSPQPKALKILAGEPSECFPTAYWRYQQGQTYRAVHLLLKRWDFDGAATLLTEWYSTLETLIKNGVTDDQHILKSQQGKVERVIRWLELAVAHFNLDKDKVTALAIGDTQLMSLAEQFSKPENLYAQCKIYYELRRISHLLSHLGSFFDVSQEDLVERLEGQFDANVKRGSRYRKRGFIKRLVDRKGMSDNTNISCIIKNWRKLDFWYDIRNQLIHGAKGINKERLKEVHHNRLEFLEHMDFQSEDQKRDKKEEYQDACTDEEILPKMRDILTSLSCIGQTSDKSNKPWNDPRYYGLYGQIQRWAIATLKS